MSLIYLVLGLAALVVIVALIWRGLSTRTSIPCPSWLGWMVEMDNPILRHNSARVIISHLALTPGMKVLDMGCGPGRLSIPLARAVGESGEVTAFDMQEKMLERVQAKARAEGLQNIRFVQGKAGDGLLGKNRFDRVLLVLVLGEIPEQQTALSEIFESLKPGGLLSITEVIADPHFQRRGKVRELTSSAGFAEQAFFGNAISYTLNFAKP